MAYGKSCKIILALDLGCPIISLKYTSFPLPINNQKTSEYSTADR